MKRKRAKQFSFPYKDLNPRSKNKTCTTFSMHVNPKQILLSYWVNWWRNEGLWQRLTYTASQLLPITGFEYGPQQTVEGKEPKITVGPLRCRGMYT